MTDAIQPDLSGCGCCEDGVSGPVEHYNRPGLPTLTYRVGVYATFLRRMLSRIHTQTTPPDDPNGALALASLSTRALDDPAIALLDAWAVTADVLTFYQERIAQEQYLNTATERRSVLELARSIGYEVHPGVAASTYLAFEVETARGTPETALVPQGTQVQSIPPPGMLPQTFETSKAFTARADWNALRPQTKRLISPRSGNRSVYLSGIDLNLRPGDRLLFLGEEMVSDPAADRWNVRRVVAVEAHPQAGYTRVTWHPGLAIDPPLRIFALRTRANIFGYNALDWRGLSVATRLDYLGLHWYEPLPDENKDEWPDFSILSPGSNRQGNKIDLDMVYPAIVPGSWLLLSIPGRQDLFKVSAVVETARARYLLAGKATQVTLDSDDLTPFEDKVRETTVFAQSAELALAAQPIATPVQGRTITLERLLTGLEPGNLLAITGKPMRARVEVAGLKLVDELDDSQQVELQAGEILWTVAPPRTTRARVRWHLRNAVDVMGIVTATPDAIKLLPASASDASQSEVCVLQQTSTHERLTVLELEAALSGCYDRTTVTINANVVAATHGETVHETLGSGNAARTNQRFTLKKPPLTYTSARGGAASSLRLRVDDLRWEEAPSLYEHGPRDQHYMVRLADDGKSTITFGDGVHGARLPTGSENVTAVYRSGIGPDGEVAAGSLTLIKTRPYGIRGAVNPLAATGAEAPERLDQARMNAPLTVLTFDRIVSLRDFEDYARAFPGIGKAQAIAVWSGSEHMVHLTVATASGASIETAADVRKNLAESIGAARDPASPIRIEGFLERRFRVKAGLAIDSRFAFPTVAEAVTAALRETFAFAHRSFGQSVTAAEVVTAIHAVAGVVAVDLDILDFSPSGTTLRSVVPALSARRAGDLIKKAELLLIDPVKIKLEERVP